MFSFRNEILSLRQFLNIDLMWTYSNLSQTDVVSGDMVVTTISLSYKSITELKVEEMNDINP